MNPAHAHLLINHFPIIGTLFGLLLLLYGMGKGSSEIKRASLGIFVLLIPFAVLSFLTGKATEEMMERFPEITEAIIERHEESATISMVAAVILGFFALMGLLIYRRSRDLPGWFIILTLLLSLATSGLMGWTANLGGQIRHTEIRQEAPPEEPEEELEIEPSTPNR